MAYREHDGSEHFGARSPRPDHDEAAAPGAARDEDPERADEAGPSPADEWFGDDFDSGPIAPPPPYAQPQGPAPSPLYPPAPPPLSEPRPGLPVPDPEPRDASPEPPATPPEPPAPLPKPPTAPPEPPAPLPKPPTAPPEPPAPLPAPPATPPEPPAPLPKPPTAPPEPPAPLPKPPAALPKPPATRPERVGPAPEPPPNAAPLSPLARNRPQIQRLLQEPQRPAPRPVTDDVPEPEPLPPLDYSDGAPYRTPAPNAPAPWGAEPPRPPEPPAAAPQSPAEQWGLTPPLGARPLPRPEAGRDAPPPHDASHTGPAPMAPPAAPQPPPVQPPAARQPAPSAPPVRPQEHRPPPPAPPGPAAFGHTPPGGTVPAEPTGFDPGGTARRRQAPASGWRRIVHSATFGLVHPGDSPAELRRRELMDRARTYVVGGHHRVAVLSLKGGVGKTTTTVALGSTLASLRGDRVLAVDANPDRGTLSDKLRLETAATIRDLLREKETISRYADIRGFTSQASSRLEVLASDRDPAVSEAFSEYDYREVSRLLEHFYSITLTDCGTGLLHSAMRGVLGLADQIVVVSTPSVDGARSASATLDWLEAHEYGYLVRGGVVVLSMVRQGGRSSVDLRRLEDHFNSRCRSVVQIPWDSHLEEGAEVHLDQLHPATRDAYLELAATVGEAFAWPR
ncbi:MinD/ParA family ATP-binding protein [Actinorugispora endophytica]|uniref:MinD-like ATPase involved in chromosome partitioning or flagellar assembly n=1 Tax=Actinorugispora endophytica TaxID=1605990 RepID=A0A4R6V4W6_9ACTN|nr:MinD/ParA family protein [Actinorugispora endophytica]TDQ55475.1 MinD-like ATPase involved in chromosome partitioning or flagellar assembly [Actinorugispora endophytica]